MTNYTMKHKMGAYNPFQGLQRHITCSRLENHEVCNCEHNNQVLQTMECVTSENNHMNDCSYVHVLICTCAHMYMCSYVHVFNCSDVQTIVRGVARVTPSFHSLTLRLASIKTSAPQLWRKYGDCV